MKYLVLAVVVLAVLWLLRGKRGTPRPPGGATKPPQTMVACAHCGVHLPRGEAVAGADGLYCSEAHRLAQGDRG